MYSCRQMYLNSNFSLLTLYQIYGVGIAQNCINK